MWFKRMKIWHDRLDLGFESHDWEKTNYFIKFGRGDKRKMIGYKVRGVRDGSW